MSYAFYLRRLTEDARNGGPIRWELVERFIEIKPRTRPRAKHGTHVAGILGASKAAAAGGGPSDDFADGMCPDIRLYEFRVLGTEIMYPVDEIDAERKKDWEKEQAKERKRPKKKPETEIQRDWSPEEHSLVALLAAHPSLAEKVRIVEDGGPHLIDLSSSRTGI
jgi:Subtilase family